jgi:hypothetical protein
MMCPFLPNDFAAGWSYPKLSPHPSRLCLAQWRRRKAVIDMEMVVKLFGVPVYEEPEGIPALEIR